MATAPRWAKRNPENLGYGGNQILGYRNAIDAGFDFVILLQGDGQMRPWHDTSMYRAVPSKGADVLLGFTDA